MLWDPGPCAAGIVVPVAGLPKTQQGTDTSVWSCPPNPLASPKCPAGQTLQPITEICPQFMVHFPRMNHHGAPSLIVTQKTGGFTGPLAILPNFRAKHFSFWEESGVEF